MTILFYRGTIGLGDLVMLMRAVELTRLGYMDATIIVQCVYPDLIRGHPAIDVVLSHKDPDPEHDIRINLSTCCAEYEADIAPLIAINRIELFCLHTAKRLQEEGYEPIEWDGNPPTLWVSDIDLRWAQRLISSAANGQKAPIGIFKRTAEWWRNWGEIHLLAQMLADDGYPVFGFDKEERINAQINHIVGRSLGRVSALVSQMGLLIAGDTAGVHIAGGLNVPIYGIFGPTDPLIRLECYGKARWAKVKCRLHPCWYTPCKKVKCLKKLKASAVYLDVKRMLKELGL